MNVGLIGFGKIGKIYYRNLIQNKKFKVIKILRKKKIKSNIFTNNRKIFFNNDYDLIIISSPTKFHFKDINDAAKKNCQIILEKPIVFKKSDLKKINKFNKYKNNIFVHYNENYNKNYIYFKKKIKGKKKYFCNLNYGKFQKIYKKENLPYFDWLPHPLFVLLDLFGFPEKYKILQAIFTKKNNFSFNNIVIKFFYYNFHVNLYFTNSLNLKKRKIEFFSKKKIYYKNKKFQTIPQILKKVLNKDKRINDIKISINIMKLLFNISNKLYKIDKRFRVK